MTAPGTILIAKMLVPETEQPKTAGTVEISNEEMHKDANILGAIARGTIDGGQLAFNVAIMLISFLALIAMVNGIMGWTHNHFAFFPQSIQKVLGVIFAPVAWLIGVPGKDIGAVGSLLGTRTVIALAPNKRDQLAKLGFRAMIAGTMANLMSASIVGLLMRS
jgi:CNT family concentrative nucleoside transporter